MDTNEPLVITRYLRVAQVSKQGWQSHEPDQGDQEEREGERKDGISRKKQSNEDMIL